MTLIAAVVEGSGLMPVLLRMCPIYSISWQRNDTHLISWLILHCKVCGKLAVNAWCSFAVLLFIIMSFRRLWQRVNLLTLYSSFLEICQHLC